MSSEQLLTLNKKVFSAVLKVLMSALAYLHNSDRYAGTKHHFVHSQTQLEANALRNW